MELGNSQGSLPSSFIDQVLERFIAKSHYHFLDGFLGFMQVDIALEDQHKTTFTCPFDTFDYTKMPFIAYATLLEPSKGAW